MLKTLAATVTLTLALSLSAAAESNYPDRTIRIVHGFAAGGNADTVSRIIADAMSQDLGQPVIVEARPGAGGTLASGYVAQQAPDGYTLQLLVGGHPVAAALYKSLPYDTMNDFTYISTVGQFPFFIGALHGRFGSLQEVIDAARAKPRSIRIGHAGVGSTQHLTGELLGLETGVEFLHVPYQGGAAATTALMGGEIDLVIDAGTVILGQADAGVFDVLGVTSATRWADRPDVPTVAEAVAPGFDVVSWTGLGAPAGLPQEIADRLNTEMNSLLGRPEVRERIAALGANPMGSTSQELHDLVERQVATWTRVINDAQIERR
ncbi:MAG: MFS transporter [Alphaproteobacteria bacterium HGW-Alphaproteobacteria-4]|jgi:tripartite-type tricarboxylate transporter receptor subunit TctC|nr:MAG: MFS transporter [Alphaproteobacteria bacterium HGW-Alphaproteobacteria-4]